MNITFVTKGLSFNGDSLTQGGLGGSETAVLCMARELAARDHKVRVFCDCDAPGVYSGVEYYLYEEFAPQAEIIPTDVLIASRFTEPLRVPSFAGLRVLWLHDLLDKGVDAFPAALFQTDKLFGLSQYHIDGYLKQHPFLERLFHQTRNGVDLEMVDANKRPKVPGKLIYTSRPERGLHYLLEEIFPKILDRAPHSQLYVASYSLQDLQPHSDVSDLYAYCQAKIEQYGDRVVQLGSLSKPELYQEISSAEVMLYPTQFPEISCISAIEAQACGTPIVTTADFALTETAGAGCLIQHPVGSEKYTQSAVNYVLDIQQDTKFAAFVAEKGLAFVEENGYTWHRIAREWEQLFNDHFSLRDSEKLSISLEESGNVAHAQIRRNREYARDYAFPRVAIKKFTAEHINAWNTLRSMLRPDIKTIYIPYAVNPAELLLFAKWFPKAQVFAKPMDSGDADWFRQALDGVENAHVCVSHPIAISQWDVIYLGSQLECESKFEKTLQALSQKLSSNGVFALAPRYRHEGLVSKRLWNFDGEDLRTVFANCESTSIFVPSGRDSVGYCYGYWAVVASKARTYSRLHLRDRMHRFRPKQSVSVCMITKNEEDWLLGCLKSIEQIADEIIIADTGSTDGTIEIARQFKNVEVHTVEFEDFSQARNASIESANGDWVLWIDADERITASSKIRKYLEGPLFDGLVIDQNHLSLDAQGDPDQPVRVFRNHKGFKFVGCIHEQPEMGGGGRYDVDIEPSLALSDVDIVHFGYITEEQRRWKCSARNIALLIKDVKENPHRMKTWMFVMRDYLNLVKWFLPKVDPVEGSVIQELLSAVVFTYFHKFNCVKTPIAERAFAFYQEALAYLAHFDLTLSNSEERPFQIGTSLAASFTEIENTTLQMRTRWFLCREEMEVFLDEQKQQLNKALGYVDDSSADAFHFHCELPNPEELLKLGLQ